MVTGDDARRRSAEARGRVDRERLEPDLGPALPDRLAAARERKGVDLQRAERDTKIRSRYLAALERGDYRELPGAVYTKGFLRNYAVYLGLDPDDVLRQWRRERGDQAQSETVIVAPRPIMETPRPLAFSPSIVVAALMTFGVILFGAYLALQLLRFAKPPTLVVTSPISAVVDIAETATTFRLAGTATPGATVTVSSGASQTPEYRVTALSDGTWSVTVDVRRGTNQFTIDALDPETGKHAESAQQVIIKVPYLVVQAPTLTVTSPQEGATYENGAIPVEGQTTNARDIIVTAVYLGSPDGPAAPTPVPTATRPPASPDPAATAAPEGLTIPVADDGTFTTPLELTEGRWSITVTATSSEGKTTSLTRAVTVAYRGVNLVVTVQGGSAWMRAWVDGVPDPRLTQAGKTLRAGDTIVFTGTTSVEVRTGSSGFTLFTLNGVSLGALGKPGIPETWLFQPPAAPQLTQRR